MLSLKSDLHLHTSADRYDAIQHTAKELIDTAAQKGFQVLAITNHDTFTYSRDLASYATDRGILLIPGIEKRIEGKHVLILNANPTTERLHTFADLLKARRDGMLVIAPHPFFLFFGSLGRKLIQNIELFDALEYSHFYSARINFNHKVPKVAEAYDLPIIGNSDCHILKNMGICHSVIHSEDQSLESVFAAILSKRVEVVSQPIFFPKLLMLLVDSYITGRLRPRS